jgi:hypothetical protein
MELLRSFAQQNEFSCESNSDSAGTRSVRLAPVPVCPRNYLRRNRRRALDQYKAGTARRVSSGKRINYSGPLVRRCAIRLAKSAGDAMTKDSGIMRALMTMSPQIATE